jgi:predicted nuclease with TOPRIM domain
MNIVETLQTWVPLTVGILTILTVIGGILYRIHKKFTVYIRDEIAEVAKEFKPNGGSSLKDQVNRLETGHNEIVGDVNNVKEDVADLKKDTNRLENKIDKMFDTLLDLASKLGK